MRDGCGVILGELICCNCGNKTIKKSPNQRRCLTCANKSYKPVYNRNIKKKCPICDLFFHAVHSSQIYCAETCRKKAAVKKLNEKWILGRKNKGSGLRVWAK